MVTDSGTPPEASMFCRFIIVFSFFCIIGPPRSVEDETDSGVLNGGKIQQGYFQPLHGALMMHGSTVTIASTTMHVRSYN